VLDDFAEAHASVFDVAEGELNVGADLCVLAWASFRVVEVVGLLQNANVGLNTEEVFPQNIAG
jgi:hypothetical protein